MTMFLGVYTGFNYFYEFLLEFVINIKTIAYVTLD